MEVILIAAAILAFIIFGLFIMFAKFYHKVEQGHAMIVNTLRSEPEVTFTGRMVYPVIHISELMDISLKTIVIKRTGKEGLICRDNIRADIEVTFFVHVNKTAEDVMKVAQAIGCSRASSQDTLEELFSAKFSEALKTVGKSMNFEDLYQERDKFRDEIIRQIGDNLSGYVLEDAAIDFLEQTPLTQLDPNNILDAQGIRKITQLTAIEHVQTNELQRNEQMQIKQKDVATQGNILELERQGAEALARQKREIASVQAREEAEAAKIQSEERSKSELARLKADQEIAVQTENAQREKEVAENNRKRAVAIEEEKVTRARQLEIVDREKEVALQNIDKEKAIEVQKKAIADVVRERIVVERTVAEQEEAIKEVRLVSEADREKKATIINAEAQAEQLLVMQVKAAEAVERSAKHKAAEQLTLAEADLQSAEKHAEAKKREAEGIEAIAAAPGLAQAKVQLASADAREKDGVVAAKVKQLDADASAKVAVVQADALRLKMEAEASGKEKLGTAESGALRQRLFAEAEGQEKLGLANVQIQSAEADVVAKRGDSDAHAVEARFQAEAKGLKDKFEAMKAMSGETRAHEEFRLRLNNAHIETLKAIEANTALGHDQAEVLGKALSNAKLEIVGGDGAYFERFVGALGFGKSIDAAMSKSQTLQTVFKDNLNGSRDSVQDMKDLLAGFGGSTDQIANLSVAALMGQVLKSGSDEQRNALQTLISGFKK